MQSLVWCHNSVVFVLNSSSQEASFSIDNLRLKQTQGISCLIFRDAFSLNKLHLRIEFLNDNPVSSGSKWLSSSCLNIIIESEKKKADSKTDWQFFYCSLRCESSDKNDNGKMNFHRLQVPFTSSWQFRSQVVCSDVIMMWILMWIPHSVTKTVFISRLHSCFKSCDCHVVSPHRASFDYCVQIGRMLLLLSWPRVFSRD